MPNSIDLIRSQQINQQVQAISLVRANQQLATYKGRDAVTGDRILKTADGGEIRARYLSTNEPSGLYSVKPGAIGVPGYAIDK